MIRNGLNLLNVSPFWQGSAIGAVIITAVLIERSFPREPFLKVLAELKGQPLVNLAFSKPCEIQAIAAERDGGIEVTSRMKTVELATEFTGSAALLTASEFELTTHDFSAMNSLERGFADKRLILAPYAIARLRSRRR